MKLFGNPLELLILDVDGVILDVATCLRRDLEAIAKRFNLPVEPISRYLTAVNAGSKDGKANLAEGLREFWPGLTPEESLRLAWCFQEERRKNPWPALEGSVETIKWFLQQKITLALCTTNDQETLQNQLLSAQIDPSWFTANSTWETAYRKPDPRTLDVIFETVPVPRNHTVYVGDWYPDLEVARGGGIRFIAVLSGGIPQHVFLREGVPNDHIIDRLSDLPRLVCA